MKIYILLLFILLVSVSCGSSRKTDCNTLLSIIEIDVSKGNLNEAIIFADSLKKQCPDERKLAYKADSLADIAQRIKLDFSLTEEQVISKLNNNLKSFLPEEKKNWEESGWLEYKAINGEKRYFNRAASNLKLVKEFHQNRAGRDSLIARDKSIIFRKKHTENIVSTASAGIKPVVPVDMKIIYTLTVKPDAVPAGETVRCWLPWPKENDLRQQKVGFISASQKDYIIAPDSAVHRTIYMEAKAEKGTPLVFKVSYSYQSNGQYFNLKNLEIKPYDKTSSLYKFYTSEQLPQICFTRKIKQMADSITGNETNPKEIVKKIYYWFNQNIPWAGALEYSIMANIPEYVLQNKKGDCGMQTFLLMSMLRYKGIPVKWQSGWMVPPEDENLHDWCEVYYEGAGWVPVDVSYSLQSSKNPDIRDFYISGIDSYRLIVNDGVSGKLYPEKKFMRSEPFDFQRGEVEWKGGNLYFDKWNYNMKIEYTGK
jgi:hypothetical protein